MRRPRKPASSFRYFNSPPEVIRLVVLIYVRFPLSLRNAQDPLFEGGIDIFRQRGGRCVASPIGIGTWACGQSRGEILDSYITTTRDKDAALTFKPREHRVESGSR